MKTACEEAAEALDGIRASLSKRLRAEGRELKAYRRLIVKIKSAGMIYGNSAEEIERAYARIQKARKK